LPELGPGETTTVKQDLFLLRSGHLKIMAHVESIHVPKQVKKKSKYEAPDLVLEAIEDIQWFQPGIAIEIRE
jgi:hypothetical protein